MSQIKAIDYVELYVGNVPQTVYFYRTAFGFTPVACASLETGSRDRMSVMLRQNDITMVVTGGLSPDSPIAEHVNLHGDSVKDVALAVDDATLAFESATSRGARPVMEPTAFEQDGTRMVKATVAAYGDTVHSFIQRDAGAPFLPNSRPVLDHPAVRPIALVAIDHVAVCVEADMLQRWVDYYVNVMDFHVAHQEDVTTEYTAMNSKQVENAAGNVKFPISEPAPSKRKSQIDEYLNFHHGPGAQHVALLSDHITHTVRALRESGIEFLKTPGTYYDVLEERVGDIGEDIGLLRELGILVDRDQWGLLLQVFTRPLQARPTVFMEIIQRRGARGFGGGNIKRLFEAIESEQALRGTL
jgi:4-hydroxyphenylpyruvate dioxygenase